MLPGWTWSCLLAAAAAQGMPDAAAALLSCLQAVMQSSTQVDIILGTDAAYELWVRFGSEGEEAAALVHGLEAAALVPALEAPPGGIGSVTRSSPARSIALERQLQGASDAGLSREQAGVENHMAALRGWHLCQPACMAIWTH